MWRTLGVVRLAQRRRHCECAGTTWYRCKDHVLQHRKVSVECLCTGRATVLQLCYSLPPRTSEDPRVGNPENDRSNTGELTTIGTVMYTFPNLFSSPLRQDRLQAEPCLRRTQPVPLVASPLGEERDLTWRNRLTCALRNLTAHKTTPSTRGSQTHNTAPYIFNINLSITV